MVKLTAAFSRPHVPDHSRPRARNFSWLMLVYSPNLTKSELLWKAAGKDSEDGNSTSKTRTRILWHDGWDGSTLGDTALGIRAHQM